MINTAFLTFAWFFNYLFESSFSVFLTKSVLTFTYLVGVSGKIFLVMSSGVTVFRDYISDSVISWDNLTGIAGYLGGIAGNDFFSYLVLLLSSYDGAALSFGETTSSFFVVALSFVVLTLSYLVLVFVLSPVVLTFTLGFKALDLSLASSASACLRVVIFCFSWTCLVVSR